MATAFQGGLAILGCFLSWLIGVDSIAKMEFSVYPVLQGIAGSIPMLMIFAVTYRFPLGPLKTIKFFLLEALGPPLAACRWYDLTWVALLAGVSEELMFRGVIQSWFSPWGSSLGILVSNILFGLAHAITPTYAILAASMGVYLGVVYEYVGDQNLIVPIVTHSFYDLVAFIVVRRGFIQEQRCQPTVPADSSA